MEGMAFHGAGKESFTCLMLLLMMIVLLLVRMVE
jgi:hypothetical protein